MQATSSQSESYKQPEIATNFGHWLNRPLRMNWETWVYVVILLLAIFTRFYILGDRTMSHDESLHTKFSWDLYKNGVFQHTPLMHGPILFHVTAFNYFLFGDNDFTARIYPAVLGVLMVMFPLLFRPWIGRWGALLASVMFLVSPLILYYNRYIREDTPSIFYTLVMVYCIFVYLNGPLHLRRKARWLYIFSAAMLASLATKEVAFMYIAIFFGLLVLYWLVRMGQHFMRLPGRSLFYFFSLAALLGGVAALGFYVILSITPLDATLSLGAGSIEYASLVKWSLLIVLVVIATVSGTFLWAFRGSRVRKPWLDVLLMLALVVVVTVACIIVEERSHVTTDASTTSVPAVPGEVVDGANTSPYVAFPLYAEWVLAAIAVALMFYGKRIGVWAKMERFAEFDFIVIMVTLVLPWATPFVMKAMNPASLTSMPDIAAAVQAALPIQVDLSLMGWQIVLSSLPVLPAIIVGVVAGVLWNPKRWLISAAVFYGLFLFFFTTVFTNLQGIGTGMIGSLGYWLEQQAVRRGNQPQYYYLVLILPFYEFLPIIGSALATFAGVTMFWRFRRDRLEQAATERIIAEVSAEEDLNDTESSAVLLTEKPKRSYLEGVKRRQVPFEERLNHLPVIIFIAWWAVFNMIAYTLAGEKMPWLGTHMTTPMILLAGWYFGRYFERIDAAAFWKRNWLYLLLLPVLFVAFVQLVSPILFGGVGGLEVQQLTRTFQWVSGIVIGGVVLYAIFRLVQRSSFTQLRVMFVVVAFGFLTFMTFRSAWMASFINYDLATEYLVYAHGAPANKEVEQQLEDLSRRITGGMDLKFAYDYRISWPGAWYFRNFNGAIFLGENPSPRQMEEAIVVIVGDENRTTVESALEDRYYRFDYPRLWWPMQDYFGLTAQRVINTLDFNNPESARIRQGIFDIWWRRDYTTYGQAVQRDFSLTKWPVADRMYVFIRKDIAAQVWSLGVGEGTALVTSDVTETNLCTANWQPLQANQIFQPSGVEAISMSFPRQVAIASDGRIYITEEFNHRVSVYNPDGTFMFSFGQVGKLYEQGDPYFDRGNVPDTGGVFNRPSGIAIGPSGNIYVADTWNFRVQVFTPDGRFLNSWGQRGEFGASAPPTPTDAFWGPRGLAVDSEERVYVADTGNKRIRVYTGTGEYLRDIGAGGSGVGQLDEPSSVALSNDGKIYVADYWNRRISVFSLDGVPQTIYLDSNNQVTNSFRVRGWVDDQGNRPYLAIDNARNLLYITDPDAGRVLVYSTVDGNCVGSFGQLSRTTTEALDLSQFNSVGGVVLDTQANVYVADSGVGRVLRFAPFPVVDATTVIDPVGESGLGVDLDLVNQAEATDVVEMTLELIIPEVTPEETEQPAAG